MAARRVVFITALGFSLSLLGVGSGPAAGSGLMVTGGLTSQPIGHYEFCKNNPRECALRPRDNGPLKTNEDVWSLIVKVNADVNKAIRPMSDRELYGKEEFWTYPVNGAGDCEDYVLEKRRRLHEAGLDLANLLITVVRKPDGEGHAVLTIRTDRGDYILDNLHSDVRLWSHTEYTFLKRQASDHTGRWLNLKDENNLLVGAVKD
ncbi:transglutaminase-like cysteine peptidase [Chelativorans sp. Marseille-P2723]|uniref:transglutaminase-like cysteine peptidase n=1 Tax=Chelativorans sp. Marseille-P2723 TaxID=2709133 RepID=UPI00157057BE|nr:transglutaminase-like cysteine peptidase [Chelativorans sp. Marseille-P2723]